MYYSEETINNESSLIRKLKDLYSQKKTNQSRVKTPQKQLKQGSKKSSKKKQSKPTKQVDKNDSISKTKYVIHVFFI